jgi:hypothetical protein
MFRQVISIRWAEGVTGEQKERYREALEGLRSIPELTALTWGDDAGIFEGNSILSPSWTSRISRQRDGMSSTPSTSAMSRNMPYPSSASE